MIRSQDDLEEFLRLEDIRFRAALKQQRILAGLTVNDLVRAAGRSAEALLKVEDVNGDPTLSSVRRYAAAIGALVQHRVLEAPLEPLEKPESGEPS